MTFQSLGLHSRALKKITTCFLIFYLKGNLFRSKQSSLLLPRNMALFTSLTLQTRYKDLAVRKNIFYPHTKGKRLVKGSKMPTDNNLPSSTEHNRQLLIIKPLIITNKKKGNSPAACRPGPTTASTIELSSINRRPFNSLGLLFASTINLPSKKAHRSFSLVKSVTSIGQGQIENMKNSEHE